MPNIARQYQWGVSSPTFLVGHCPNCRTADWLEESLPYTANDPKVCTKCGRTHSRHEWIQAALVDVDLITWGLLASDFVAWDRLQMSPDDWATYDVKEQVAKWLHEEALPRPGAGTHVGVINAWGDFVMVSLEPAEPSALAAPPSSPPIDVTWYRFGLRELDVVPAWRQSMFAAALMIESNPSAALVLIAAGFEAFFLETMRINWKEKGLRMSSFGRIRKQAISSLIDWLPGAVGLRSLSDSPDNLEAHWKNLINERRNDVVHRANVHFTSAQARESFDCAIRCISFIDELGIFRPHVYFAGT